MSEKQTTAAESKVQGAPAVKSGDAQGTPTVKSGDVLVEYTAPLMPSETKRDIFVAVNGETIRIKRGETVKIKRKFVEALNNANRQQLEAYQSSAQAQEQGRKPLANM